MTHEQAIEILRLLQSLPSEKIAEVSDYLRFLREQYGKPHSVDESDSWSVEDMREIAAASLAFSEKSSQGRSK